MQIARLLFTIFIGLFIFQANAETQLSTEHYQVHDFGWFTTKSDACQASVGKSFGGGTLTSASLNSGSCSVTYSFGGGTVLSILAQYKCPSTGGWTADSAVPPLCSRPDCAATETRDPVTGACTAPPCEPGCNGACGSTKRFLNFRTRACIDQCIYKLGTGVGVGTTDGNWYYGHDVGDNTGVSCTPEMDNSLPDPQPCPECECIKNKQSYVVMAGVATCVEPGTLGSEPVKKQDPPKIETTTPAPTPENPNPEPVETETPSPVITITPAPPGSPAGTAPTITETTTNPDGSTSSTAQGQDSFCQSNPNHALCKADDAKRFCEENPDVLACQKLDEPGEGEAIGEKTIDLAFSPVDVPGSTGGSCPAPVTISIGGRSASLSWDWLCQYATGIKPAVLAVAWLSAALIVFGAVRERD